MLELDQDRVDALRAIMAEDRLLALAAQLAAGITAIAAARPDDRHAMLHRLRGGAATLGFDQLAAALLAAESDPAVMARLAGWAPAIVPALAARLQGGATQR